MESSIYHDMARLQQTHWWFRGRRSILDAQLKQLRLRDNAPILEIGCGPGGNLAMLQHYGRVDAVEMDDSAIEMASRVSGIHVRKGWLPDAIPHECAGYDLVCLFDVLEHVEDDLSALKVVYELLNPGGYAVITVPAGQWMYGKHDRLHHHFRRYGWQQLHKRLTQAGLQCQKLSYFNTVLFPVVAAFRLAEKVLPIHLYSTDTAQASGCINTILYACFSAERHWLKLMNLPFGVSLLAVYRK